MDDQEVQLGAILAAFIATCQGIGLDYGARKHVGQPVGEYWIALARRVIAAQSKRSAESASTEAIQ